jgi:hypothetical protein
MTLRLILAGVCLLWASTDGAAQVVGSGNISGRVEDADGAAIPGVTLAIKGPGFAAEAISDAAGLFSVDGIIQPPPATYTIRATIPGFAPVVRNVVAGPGGNVEVVVTLLPLCGEPDLYIDPGIPEALRSASGVFLLRIERAAAPRHWTVGTNCGDATEYTATVFARVKVTHSSTVGTLSFLVFGNYRYEVGSDYLALLLWEPTVDRYQIFSPNYVLPVRSGIIECEQLREGLPCGSFVTDALGALRSLAGQP